MTGFQAGDHVALGGATSVRPQHLQHLVWNVVGGSVTSMPQKVGPNFWMGPPMRQDIVRRAHRYMPCGDPGLIYLDEWLRDHDQLNTPRRSDEP